MRVNAGLFLLIVLPLTACGGLPDGAADACLFGLNDAEERIAQCDAWLVDQADVDALDGVVEVSGDLRILARRQIDDLGPLSALRRVGGSFAVSALYAHPARISSLAGLDALTTVEGSFSVRDTLLEDVSAFSALTRIGGTLSVHENARLENLDGLASVAEIGGDIDLVENEALVSVGGLRGVTRLGGVDWAPCDGGNLGNLEVLHNPRLLSLDGLQGVQIARAVLVAGDDIASVDGLTGLSRAERLEVNAPLVPPAELEGVRAHVALCEPGGLDTDVQDR